MIDRRFQKRWTSGPLFALLMIGGPATGLAALHQLTVDPRIPPSITAPAVVPNWVPGGASLLQRSQIPLPNTSPVITQRAGKLADQSMSVLETGADAAQVAADSGYRVVKHGADLLDRVLPPTPAPPPAAMPTAPPVHQP